MRASFDLNPTDFEIVEKFAYFLKSLIHIFAGRSNRLLQGYVLELEMGTGLEAAEYTVQPNHNESCKVLIRDLWRCFSCLGMEEREWHDFKFDGAKTF